MENPGPMVFLGPTTHPFTLHGKHCFGFELEVPATTQCPPQPPPSKTHLQLPSLLPFRKALPERLLPVGGKVPLPNRPGQLRIQRLDPNPELGLSPDRLLRGSREVFQRRVE